MIFECKEAVEFACMAVRPPANRNSTMQRGHPLSGSSKQGELSHHLGLAFQKGGVSETVEKNPLLVTVRRASSGRQKETTTGTDTDVWAEFPCKGAGSEEMSLSSDLLDDEYEDIFVVQEHKKTNDLEELGKTLKEFLACIKHVKGTVADDMHAVSRQLAKHSAGVTSARSFGELQHHINEIVQLSGPELGCAWSTVKVGVGVASVLSGNLLVGSFMVALAAGSLGTSLVWKAHRDSQRKPESPTVIDDKEESRRRNERNTVPKGCVSRLRMGDDGESRDPRLLREPSTRQSKDRMHSVQWSLHTKDLQDGSVLLGAGKEQLEEYDAWSGKGKRKGSRNSSRWLFN